MLTLCKFYVINRKKCNLLTLLCIKLVNKILIEREMEYFHDIKHTLLTSDGFRNIRKLVFF